MSFGENWVFDYKALLIDKVINQSFSGKLVPGSAETSSNRDYSITFYFKLPFISDYSSFTQKRLALLAKRYCNDINIKLVFSSFEIGSLFSVKDHILSDLRACVAYKFSCAGSKASYVGETVRHLLRASMKILYRIEPRISTNT